MIMSSRVTKNIMCCELLDYAESVSFPQEASDNEQ